MVLPSISRGRTGGWVVVLGSRSSTVVVVGRSTIGIVLGSRCRWLVVVNNCRMGIVLGGRWSLSLVDPIPLCPTIYMFVQMPASPDIHVGADPRGNGYRDS